MLTSPTAIRTCIALLLISPSLALAISWESKGQGGWRTSDANGNPVTADKGPAHFDTGFARCQQLCEADPDCKGVEYISDSNGWHEDGRTVFNKCEIHQDPFKLCDTNGGGRGSPQDGCWVQKLNDVPFMNDTGITTCGDNADNKKPCPISTHPGQDAQAGRDAHTSFNNGVDGHRGFDYLKVRNDGTMINDQTKTWVNGGTEDASTHWTCVKDDATGLTWESKTDDGSIHDKDWTYAWFMPGDRSQTIGHQGTSSTCSGISPCNTQALIDEANRNHWCAHNDWRLPTVDELYGLVNFNVDGFPLIEQHYFPNTMADYHWTSSTAAINAPPTSTIPNLNFAWGVGFIDGFSGASRKTVNGQANPKRVRLVSGQARLQ